YTPWAFIEDKKKRLAAKGKKQVAFVAQRSTTHWPLNTKLFPMRAQTYGQPPLAYNTSQDVIRQPEPAFSGNEPLANVIGAQPADGPAPRPLLPFSHRLMALNKTILLD